MVKREEKELVCNGDWTRVSQKHDASILPTTYS